MEKKKLKFTNSIIWITLAMILMYIFVSGMVETLITVVIDRFIPVDIPAGLKFALELYFPTIGCVIVLFIYLWVVKKNRPIIKTFAYGHENNNFKMLFLGLLVGFVMNFSCILLALLHHDIELSLGFALKEIPIFIIALVCVCMLPISMLVSVRNSTT